MFMIWAVMQIGMFVMSWRFLGSESFSASKYLGPKVAQTAKDVSSTADQTNERPVVDPHLLPPVDAQAYWPSGVNLDMHVYLTTLPRAEVYTTTVRKEKDEGLPHFVWKNITYGNYNDQRVINFEVKFPEVKDVICISKVIDVY